MFVLTLSSTSLANLEETDHDTIRGSGSSIFSLAHNSSFFFLINDVKFALNIIGKFRGNEYY